VFFDVGHDGESVLRRERGGKGGDEFNASGRNQGRGI
jgi:hypothetical protein